ncbi:MAG TPA: glycosyltransferase family 39 protein, partial [Acetobacteraceae bacterium]|nr:glycosyltransferase family 39 protein [Acetobacteraceae bacterium]
DFGYADQPPLAPLLAAATQMFGENLFLLRLPAALAAAALVPVTAAIARLLGGGRAGGVIAAIAIIASPALTAMSSTFGTSTFEPIGWTLIAYLVLRGAVRGESAALLWAGIAAGVTFEAKFGVAVWALGLVVGLLLTNYRGLLASRAFWIAAALAAAIGAPPLIWQALHGFPFREIIAYHSAEGRIFSGGFKHFWIAQSLGMNIVLAPLWLTGLVAPFLPRGAQAGRVAAGAFVVTAAAVFAAHGKDYYLFPAYPAVFATGAASIARLHVLFRTGWCGLALANAALLAPITLPLLSPDGLFHFMQKTHIRPSPNEAAGVGAKITQVFSDEFGWRGLATTVAAIYRGLPDTDRAATGIFAWNYGEAASIDFFTAGSGLPPAMSSENQYYVWGPRDGDVHNLILVNVDADVWKQRCATLTQVATFGARYAMPYESDRPIFLCRGLVQPLAAMWPETKWGRGKRKIVLF